MRALTLTIATATTLLGAGGLWAQNIKTISKKGLTIGLSTGVSSHLSGTQLVGPQNDIKLKIRKTISRHFSAEGTLNNAYPINSEGKQNQFIINNPGHLSFSGISATTQYRFLPEKCKVHPYCGAGLQYSLNVNPNAITPFPSGDVQQAAPQKTKYINLLLTQGVTYKISTRIELNQSFHFTPSANSAKEIGFDIGIGYHLP